MRDHVGKSAVGKGSQEAGSKGRGKNRREQEYDTAIVSFVEGRLKSSTWEQDGRNRNKLTVTVSSFQFVGDRPKDQEPKKRARPLAAAPVSDGDIDEDEIPF